MSGQLRERVGIKGLVTDPNELELTGDGAMRTLTNFSLARPGLAACRRGVTRNASNSVAINKFFNYDLGLLFHCGSGGSGQLKSLSAGVVTAIAGAVNPPGTGRLRTCIAGKNLYYAGVVPGRLSGIAGTPIAAGGLFAPGFDTASITLAAGNAIVSGKCAAYRYLFGFTDAKGNTHLGEPSGRLIVNNASGADANPTIRANIPTGATANHFIQFYRSAGIAIGTQPDDDLQLVFEQQIKALDLSNGYLDLADIVPDNLRGAYIYTAPNAGEGILNANRAPPGCTEVCSHKTRTWFGNTTQPGEFLLNILATGGSAGIQNGDTLRFGGLTTPFTMTGVVDVTATSLVRTLGTTVTVTTDVAHGYSNGDSVTVEGGSADFGLGPFIITVTGTFTFTYAEAGSNVTLANQAVHKTLTAGQYLIQARTDGTVSANLQGTGLNLVAAINKHASNSELWAQYLSGPTDVPGQILIRGRTAATGGFTIQCGQSSQRNCFSPHLTPYLGGVAWSLSRVSNVVTATISSGAHLLVVGEQVLMGSAGSGSFAPGTFTITGVTSTTFTYAQAGSNAGPLAGQVFSLYPTDIATAEVESKPNRVYYSKLAEYEATTRNGYVDVGGEDAGILAMLSQRGQIWVWKTDGIYRIVGDDPATFDSEALDTSLHIRATETIVLFSNRCWGLTDRGVVAVSETGLETMSKAIATDLRTLMVSQATVLNRDAFATAYESEHLYILHLPPGVDSTGATGVCKAAFAYSTQGQSWEYRSWGERDGDGKRCGIVNAQDDLLYFGDQFSGLLNTSYIYKERKALTAADFVDTDGTNTNRPIDQTATWVLQTQDAPGAEKRWDELEFLFVSNQAPFTLTLANETTTADPIVVASQGTKVARVWVPAEVARGARLLVTVTHSVAAEAFDLAGIALRCEVLDGAPTR